MEHETDLRAIDPNEHIIARLRYAIAVEGQMWHLAVLAAIADWSSDAETLPDGRRFEYVIAGEAFDWLLLAERLLLAIDDVVPEDERDTLLFHGVLPEVISEEEFRRLVGTAKYRAHLNYIYGIRIEEALQLAVQEELHKEHRSSPFGVHARVQETMFMRLYGKSRDDLHLMYREETGATEECGETTIADLKSFTYWLFKFRVRRCEPARIASDTRKGIDLLQKLEQIRRSSPLFSDPRPDGVLVEA